METTQKPTSYTFKNILFTLTILASASIFLALKSTWFVGGLFFLSYCFVIWLHRLRPSPETENRILLNACVSYLVTCSSLTYVDIRMGVRGSAIADTWIFFLFLRFLPALVNFKPIDNIDLPNPKSLTYKVYEATVGAVFVLPLLIFLFLLGVTVFSPASAVIYEFLFKPIFEYLGINH